jgi:hypothetical protein
MGGRTRTIIAALLLAAGAAGAIWLLAGQGLDRAEKWVSLVGVVISVAVSSAGLALGWLTWRSTTRASGRTGNGGSAAPARVSNSKGVQIGDHNTQNNHIRSV